jgi:Leucine-rich repeat (LRR) protein
MDDLLYRTLLKADPSSSVGRQLLRLFHPVSTAGHLAALRTSTKLELRHAQPLGVPYSWQLSVLTAADRACTVNIDSSQISGLPQALASAQQQQQQQEEEEGQELSVAGLPASKPHTSRLTQLGVTGKLSKQGVGQLMRLLDLLPGTQRLQRLCLWEVHNENRLGQQESELIPPQLLGAEATQESTDGDKQHISSSSTGSGTGASSSSTIKEQDTLVLDSTGGSWRSSCSQLVARSRGYKDTSRLSDLRPLLEALPQLQMLELRDISYEDLALFTPLLGSVRDLRFSGYRAMASPGLLSPDGKMVITAGSDASGRVLEAVAGMTQLQRLTLAKCTPFRPAWQGLPVAEGAIRLPTSLLNLKQLRSLALGYTHVHSSALELLPEFELLEELDLSRTFVKSHLLTDTLPRLTGLTGLVLQQSSISSLPEGMAALSRLRKLDWSLRGDEPSQHHGTLLPWLVVSNSALQLGGVWRLTGLHSLIIADDSIRALPADVTQLSALTELRLTAVRMCEPPVHLSSLSDLRVLSIKSRHLPAVMEAVTTLTHLTQVQVSDASLPHQALGPGLSPAVQAFVDARTPA